MKNPNFPQLTGMVTENKGFSFNPHTGELNPTEGYMASLSGHEHRESIEGLSAIAIEKILFKYFMGAYKYAVQIEKEKGRDLFMGAWMSGDTLVLDVSRHFKKRRAAALFQLLNKQEAVWNCEKGYSETIHVPLTINDEAFKKMSKEDIDDVHDDNGILIYIEGVTEPIPHPDHEEL